MPYIGSILSVNNCWIRGKGGRRTNCYHHIVKIWMGSLEEKSSEYKDKLIPPIYVKTSGCFKDNRRPDMDNLEKIICDGLKKGLGIDDKYFIRIAGPVEINYYKEPTITLEIWDRTYTPI